MKLNNRMWILAPLLICFHAVDVANSYGAFFPSNINRGRPPSSRGRTNSRSHYNPYKSTSPSGVFCRNGQFQYGCCKGWERNAFGQCQPVCSSRCVHGRCAGPNRCQCDQGWTGKTCNQDYNECAVRPCQHRCMNTQGSFRCYCEHGYLLLPDQRSCTADDRCYKTRCAFGCLQFRDGFKCFCPDGLTLTSDGLGCQDVDECAEGTVKCAKGRRCVNTYGNYMCLCPEGFHYAYVDGSIECVDMDECSMQMHRCHKDAHCINAVDGYECQCNEGYLGDGYKCVEWDQRTCGETPCFPGVECTDVEVDVEEIDLAQVETVRSFVCGDCPGGHAGTGLVCEPSETDLRVLVIDPIDDLRVPDAEVTAFDRTDNGRRVTSSLTDSNGLASLTVPMFSDIIITASKESYLDNSITFQVVPGASPFLEIRITRATGAIEGLYNPEEEASFRFTRSVDDSTFVGAINVPQFALDVGPGTMEKAYMVVPDAENATQVDLAPVLQADPSSFPDGESRSGEHGGAAESQQLRENGRHRGTKIKKDPNRLRQPSTGPSTNRRPGRRGEGTEGSETPMSKSPLDAVALAYVALEDDQGSARDRLVRPVTIEISLAKYENRNLRHGDKMDAWRYDEVQGLWTYAGEGDIRSYPGNPDRLIFVYETTDLGWIAAANLVKDLREITIITCIDDECSKRVPNVPLWLHGMDSVYVEPVFTDDNGKAKIVVREGSKFTLEHRCNGRSKHFENTANVRRINLTIYGENTCPDPGEPENGVRFGDDFTVGADVKYFCDPGYLMEGSSQRVCNGCGIWSGYQTFCVENVDSDFSSLSSSALDFGYSSS